MTPNRIALIIATFLGLLLASTIAAEIIWDCAVMDRLYHCTDSLGFNYIRGPSSWVHGHFVGNVSNMGDTIAAGWNMSRLLVLWFSFVGVSIAISAWATMIIHRGRGHADTRRGFEPIQRD